jgi:hypothetical protein
MLNYSSKEFVRAYYYSDMKRERFHIKSDIVNGRLCQRFGTHTATSVILNMYKVYDPSVKSSKYVYLGGVARQHPNDHTLNSEEGYEMANLHAQLNPSIILTFDSPADTRTLLHMMEMYVEGLPKQFVRTKQEIAALEDKKYMDSL